MQISKFLQFLALGGFAAAVNVTVRWLLTPFLGFEWSVVVGYVTGMCVAYVLFRTFVFGASGQGVMTESLRFVLVNVVALALVWIVSVVLARVVFPGVGFTWHAEDIAHLVGVAVPAFSSYVGHSRFTFKAKSPVH